MIVMLLSKAKSLETSRRVARLVEAALSDKGVSARRASIEVVGHDGLIRDIRAGRSPSIERIIALFEYLEIPISLGEQRVVQETIPWGFSEASWKLATPRERESALAQGYLPIPYHRDVGSGFEGAAPIAFSGEYLHALGVEPEFLSFVVAVSVGSAGKDIHALVNSAAERTSERTVWAYVYLQKAGVAYLSWPDPKTVLIESLGGDEPIQVLTAQDVLGLRLLGKVVWTSAET